ncbi:hypothetical protein F4805DRAFT_469599 [Annulohypoxylon moriforme]|nr:hypothetical protein F4805DRAFT_469599 [Annulohypoxylon moriforme]
MAAGIKEPCKFQAPEHRQIGDRAVLPFSDGNLVGANFNYRGSGFPHDLTISLGQIIALAGDFYGNCKIIGDAEQISDHWKTNPEASIRRFISNTELLNKNSRGYLQPVLNIMLTQEREIAAAIRDGKDVAQHDRDWAIVTQGDYLLLSLCNWDHFGQDAVSAYSAGHTAALRQAQPNDANLYVRSNVDNRLASTYDAYPLSNVPWTQIFNRISGSGQSQNQLPLTLELLCPTRVIHFRVVDDLNISVAQYGTVYSHSTTMADVKVESWNLLKQKTLSVPQSSGKTSWNAAQKIDDNGAYSLVGRVLLPSGDINAYHVGLKVVSNNVEVLWADEVEDSNVTWTAGKVWYGRFDTSNNTLLELWVFDSGTQDAPTRKRTEWPLEFKFPPYTAFSLRIEEKDPSEIFVTSALDTSVSPAKTLWTFSSWKKGYSSLAYSTCNESLSERAQKTIVKRDATGSTANRVIRLFYGEKYSKPGYIRIDVLQLSKSLVKTISSSEIKVTWFGQNYLTWFLSDINGDGNSDLVGVVADDSNGSLTVLAFKPKLDEKSGFESPIASKITSDKGPLLTASFMKPILAGQAAYRFPDSPGKVDSGILMAFDNYGIMGVRLLRPKRNSGTLSYEISGQLPAIAGQMSASLGQATRLFETGKEAIGLFVEY